MITYSLENIKEDTNCIQFPKIWAFFIVRDYVLVIANSGFPKSTHWFDDLLERTNKAIILTVTSVTGRGNINYNQTKEKTHKAKSRRSSNLELPVSSPCRVMDNIIYFWQLYVTVCRETSPELWCPGFYLVSMVDSLTMWLNSLQPLTRPWRSFWYQAPRLTIFLT